MIRYYFRLQWTIITRHFDEWGIGTIGGILMSSVLFLGFSFYLFYKTEWAVYAYGVIGLSVISALGEKKRSDFLNTIFQIKQFKQIRILENVICILPFLFFLVFKNHWLESVILFFTSIVLAIVKLPVDTGKALPTPFGKIPFEFPIGFRKTWFLILLTYILAGIAIKVDNFNLGAFAILFCFAMIITFYGYLENYFYVWIFKSAPFDFLYLKIKTAVIYSTLVVLPLLIILSVFYNQQWWILLLLWIFGELYLSTSILSKYTAFPREMTIPNGILLGLSILFPPLLLALIPYFYTQSVRSLQSVLV